MIKLTMDVFEDCKIIATHHFELPTDIDPEQLNHWRLRTESTIMCALSALGYKIDRIMWEIKY